MARLRLPGPDPRESVAVRRLLLAGLGAVYAVAFASLLVQVEGLVGSRGILPNAELFAHLRDHPRLGFVDAPSACWVLGCSDGALVALASVGLAAGLALAAGLLPLASAAVAWFAYLSLLYAGRVFLSFQWDTLLLEAGFLAILLAPPRAVLPTRAHWSAPPPRVALFLLQWLLFRLMLSSGLSKLASGDPTWRDGSALAHHFETQPLPTPPAWLAHQLPPGAHELLTYGTLVAEIGVPLLFFAPRPARLLGAAATAGFMAAIAATGNYGFFNLLTIVLCLALVDDRVLPARLRRALVDDASPAPGAGRAASRRRAKSTRGWSWPRAITVPIAVFLVAGSLCRLAEGFGGVRDWPAPVAAMRRVQDGFRLVGGYGLFANMTTERPEIVVQGRREDTEWRTYRFRWKPGDPEAAPPWVQPHMPRLDWQMWFAALSDPNRQRWFVAFGRRLLEGSPPVLALLAENPFPDAPPTRVRARLYDYRFTEWGTPPAETAWWRRVRRGAYLEPLELAPESPIGVRIAPD